MKAYEMPVKISDDGKLELPQNFVKLLPHDKLIKIILLIPELDENIEDKEWSKLTADQFLNGYSDSDSIYDRL